MDVNNLLDRIRQDEGKENLGKYYKDLLHSNTRQAINLINDDNLSFPSFYILLPYIKSYGLYRHLSNKNKLVINIVNHIMQGDKYRGNNYLDDNSEESYNLLKWIVDSGNSEYHIDDDYNQIIDISVSILLISYNDKSILPIVSDMIFDRHKNGLNNNDLVWAFFNVKDLNAVQYLAKHMAADNEDERKLACDLLGIDDNMLNDYSGYHNNYLEWLKENDAFVYISDESCQLSSKPKFIKTDYGRKYLVKGTDTYYYLPIEPSNESERNNLKAFKLLSDKDKELLSEYSYSIYKNNVNKWQEWISSPIENQVKDAKSNKGGEL